MRKGEATKQRIIEKAAPVFNRLGYGTASLSDIMAATGLEKGGIYRHFSSKEALACEAFDYAYEAAHEAKFAVLAGAEDGWSKLQSFVRDFASRPSVVPGGCPVFNTAVEHDHGNAALKKRAVKAYRTWIAVLTETVEQAKREGALQAQVDSESMATFLLTSLEGALIAKNLTGQTTVMTKVTGELLAYLESHRS